MNFLAHLYLSGSEPDLIIGNFIADMVKGSRINGYSDSVVRGILLHRDIDRFTDMHPLVSRSKQRLRKKYRLYSGVIVDMYYDHFLALNWADYSVQLLEQHVEKAYGLLEQNMEMLPPRAQEVFPYMVRNNWLVNYADLDCLPRFFGGMARRTPFDSRMEHAVEDLKQGYDLYGEEFRDFFPELVAYVQSRNVALDCHLKGSHPS